MSREFPDVLVDRIAALAGRYPAKQAALLPVLHLVQNEFGQGRTTYVAACPAIAYLKEAKFVPDAMREKWPAEIRSLINQAAEQRGAKRLVDLSHAVVEAGVYDAPAGTALVLANFTYEPIPALKIRLSVPRNVRQVRSLERGPLKFSVEEMPGGTTATRVVACELALGITDIILFEEDDHDDSKTSATSLHRLRRTGADLHHALCAPAGAFPDRRRCRPGGRARG